jgi:hypothetical protein
MKIHIIILLVLSGASMMAHPMPNSVMLLNVGSNAIYCELQLPLKEMQYALPFDVTRNTTNLLRDHQQDLANYIIPHFNVKGKTGEKWDMIITKMSLANAEQTATGIYQELIVTLIISPSGYDNLRAFTINYDAIIHQVVTHQTLVSVREDWRNAQFGNKATELGIIRLDTKSNVIFPFEVNLDKGSYWMGFSGMVLLGIDHITEGVDHLLFLLVLLLPATLLYSKRRWTTFGGAEYSFWRIIKIVTAFTVGHSITLLAGATGLVHFASRPVEILIALSILITAIHAIKPFFFVGKETYIAMFFGLIHGLAFASTLSNMNLEGTIMALSILGFNIGIELMQLFVIVLVMPWLILMSDSKIYTYIRIGGAIFAAIAAIAWMSERITTNSNIITKKLELLSTNGIYIIAGLAGIAIVNYLVKKMKIEAESL